MFNTDSGYSNCVVAQKEEEFIGKNLLFSGNAKRSTVKTEKCIDFDEKLDKGDGNKSGKVRWIECPAGPDCDETGMN